MHETQCHVGHGGHSVEREVSIANAVKDNKAKVVVRLVIWQSWCISLILLIKFPLRDRGDILTVHVSG
jgi:hypothetical protein